MLKLITERYGQPCEIIESTLEEFYIMKNVLKSNGVEARLISCTSEKICTWQIRNSYKDALKIASIYSDYAKKLYNRVEKDVKEDVWSL